MEEVNRITFDDIQKANETIVTTDIKGKDYAEVNQRIKAFRMVYPTGFIHTDMINNNEGICVFRATVGFYQTRNTIADDDNKKMYQDSYSEKIILATGTAYEKENSSFINKTSYIENCETSAVGRALGMAGFGIDTSVASADEVRNAMNNQLPTEEDAKEYVFTFGKHKDKKLVDLVDEGNNYIDWLLKNSNDEYLLKCIELLTGMVRPTEEEQDERLELTNKLQRLIVDKGVDLDAMLEYYKVDNTNKLSNQQLNELIDRFEKRENK